MGILKTIWILVFAFSSGLSGGFLLFNLIFGGVLMVSIPLYSLIFVGLIGVLLFREAGKNDRV